MTNLPSPSPGLVIRYSYLWRREHLKGHEEGTKDRPCAIIAALRDEADGGTRVLVIPVTHSPPAAEDEAVELPQHVKSALGLDSERSWIVLSEWNDFIWPGPDVRRLPGGSDASIAYGSLPAPFFRRVHARFLKIAKEGRARRVVRTT